MSYILDALKRAESERSRGEVPNLHAQPTFGGGPEADDPVPGRLGWVVMAVAVLALAAAGWWWWSGDSSDGARESASVAADAHSLGSTPPAVMPSAEPPLRPKPVAPTVPPAVKPKPVVPATRPATATADATAATRPVAGKSQAPASAAGDARVYTLKELPDEIRNSLPVLTVGGATYSESPANRMLIINGQLFHEGDKLTSEVTLQQIKLRGAVLSFRGYRYSISY